MIVELDKDCKGGELNKLALDQCRKLLEHREGRLREGKFLLFSVLIIFQLDLAFNLHELDTIKGFF